MTLPSKLVKLSLADLGRIENKQNKRPVFFKQQSIERPSYCLLKSKVSNDHRIVKYVRNHSEIGNLALKMGYMPLIVMNFEC
jgi:hypothetical protein